MKKLLLSIFVLCISASTYAQTPSWVFSRASVAKKSFSTGGIRDTAINVPRVSDSIEIEGQRTNKSFYSESYNNWSKGDVTITSDTALYPAPDGTTNADIVHENNAPAAVHGIWQSDTTPPAIGYYTFSIYSRAVNRQWVFIRMYAHAIGQFAGAYFNLSTGAIGTVSNGTAKIEPVGNGWYRISVSGNATGVGNYISHDLYVAEADGDITFDGLDQDSVVAFGSQWETGSFATSYCGPTVAASVTCTADNLSMVPDAQNTNYAKQSETPSVWGLSNASITNTSATTLPNGAASGLHVIHENNTLSQHYAYTSSTVGVVNTTYTVSIYLKPINRNYAIVCAEDIAHRMGVNLTTGAVTLTGATNGTADPVGNGWWRFSFNFVSTGTTNYTPIVYLSDSFTNVPPTFQGLNQDSIFVWGAQVETGSRLTTYCGPTGVSAVSCDMNVDRILPQSIGVDTNICLQSQTFDVTWAPSLLSVVTDTPSQLAPDGTQTVDILHEDGSAASQHYIATTVNVVAGAVYTASAYVKGINRSWVLFLTTTGGTPTANFNVTAGTVGTTAGASGVIVGGGAGMYRASMTFTATATAAIGFRIYLEDSDGGSSFNGLNQDSVYIWGAQVEQNTVASPYIPTTIASVSRDKPASKLTIEMDMKCEFANGTEVGGIYRTPITISDALLNPSSFTSYFYTNSIYWGMYDSAGINRYFSASTVGVALNQWNKYKIFIDFSDLSRSNCWINDVLQVKIGVTNMTGPATINVGAGHVISIGSRRGSYQSYCKHKNTRIESYEF